MSMVDGKVNGVKVSDWAGVRELKLPDNIMVIHFPDIAVIIDIDVAGGWADQRAAAANGKRFVQCTGIQIKGRFCQSQCGVNHFSAEPDKMAFHLGAMLF